MIVENYWLVIHNYYKGIKLIQIKNQLNLNYFL